MPELPEVETTCRGIKPHLIDQTIDQIIIRTSKLRWPIATDLKQKLVSQQILDVSRRAKYILIKTSNGYLVIHLGMSGTLQIVSKNHKLKKHDHFDCCFTNGLILRYNDPRRFGAILWTKMLNELAIFNKLGLEPFSRDFNGEYLYQKAKKHQIPIKNFIMNHHIVVGVGNIYASESLFAAQIAPQMLCNQLTQKQAQRLVKAIRAILSHAIKLGGTTLKDFYQSDGKPGYFKNNLKVYDRKGEPCPRCKMSIQSVKIAQRMTYYCAHCQAT